METKRFQVCSLPGHLFKNLLIPIGLWLSVEQSKVCSTDVKGLFVAEIQTSLVVRFTISSIVQLTKLPNPFQNHHRQNFERKRSKIVRKSDRKFVRNDENREGEGREQVVSRPLRYFQVFKSDFCKFKLARILRQISSQSNLCYDDLLWKYLSLGSSVFWVILGRLSLNS